MIICYGAFHSNQDEVETMLKALNSQLQHASNVRRPDEHNSLYNFSETSYVCFV